MLGLNECVCVCVYVCVCVCALTEVQLTVFSLHTPLPAGQHRCVREADMRCVKWQGGIRHLRDIQDCVGQLDQVREHLS